VLFIVIAILLNIILTSKAGVICFLYHANPLVEKESAMDQAFCPESLQKCKKPIEVHQN